MYSNARLVYRDSCYFIYADSRRFGDNAMLFQSPVMSDVDRYVRENGIFLGFEPCTTRVEDPHELKGKTLKGYYRMYFDGYSWGVDGSVMIYLTLI